MTHRPAFRYISARGFSLVELMVAVALGLVLLAGVLQIFLSSKQTYRTQEAMSRLQENGRYAIDALSRKLRMAGYMGCAGPLLKESSTATGVVKPGYLRNTVNGPDDYLWDFATIIQGFEATSASAWSPAITNVGLPTAGTGVPLGDNDILTVRSTFGTGIRVTAHPGGTLPGSADIKVNNGSGLAENEIVLVSDCTAAAVFQITNINTTGGGQNVVHNQGAGSPGNRTQQLGRSYKEGGEILRLSTQTYYIANSTMTNPIRPALWLKDGTADPVELVEGVERMQVVYGADTNGDRVADVYRTANAVTDWAQIVSARISLLMRTIETNVSTGDQTYTYDGVINTASDKRLRQVFTTVVGIRNRLP